MTAWELPASVRTARLVLRTHRADDVDDDLVFHSDPDVVRYLPWPVRDRDAVIEFLKGRVVMVAAVEDGQWIAYAIELEGRVIGEVLLHRVDDERGIAEVGYAVAADVQGRGYASEAVTGMLELGEQRFGVRRFEALVDERNTASIRLLERAGFAFVEAAPTETEPLLQRWARGEARSGA